VRSVESTALRVLRGIEEEGQRGKASAIGVKITPDVAVFMLNKKRGELARIENEYEMSVSFDPDSEIMTGAFEISRIAQRSAEERPHKHSVSIEAGLATPSDISEEIEEETAEEEIQEEAGEQDEDVATSETSEEDKTQQNGEGNGRRRRRRGGRGRNRSRGREDRPQEMQEAIPNAPAAEGDFEAGPAETDTQNDEQQEGASAEGQQGEGRQRRRRRRRRGHRGRRDGEGHQQTYTNDSETSPTDAGGPGADQTAPGNASEPLAAKPNAESAPVWSLGGGSEKPRDAQQSSEPAAPAPVPSPKKGWWQRAFSSKE
jgi:ribonuclease E